jgi:hypothetical protein
MSLKRFPILSPSDVQVLFGTTRDCAARFMVDVEGEVGEVEGRAEGFSTGRVLEEAPAPSYAGGASSGVSVDLDDDSGGTIIVYGGRQLRLFYALMQSC